MSKQRISRVFLQNGGAFYQFLISSLDFVSSNGIPSLEQQVRMSMANKQIHLDLRLEEIDSHWVVEYEGRVVRIADFPTDLSSKCYEYAVEEAKRRAENFSKATNGRNYVLIDLTSRADIRESRKMSGEIPPYKN